MTFYYVCNKCIEATTGKPVKELSVAEYRDACARLARKINHPAGRPGNFTCETHGCGLEQCVGVEASYIRGYGLSDRQGVINDMNLYKMTSGGDPYADHRKPGDTKELVSKLRRNKRHRPKTSAVFMR